MIIRQVGSDAEMEFAPDVLALLKKAENAFPGPEYAVVFIDAEEEAEEDDTLMLCRRYSGVQIPVAYVTFDELDMLEAESTDWAGELKADLARTQEQIDAEPAVEEVGVAPE